jgi:hypothetical protein
VFAALIALLGGVTAGASGIALVTLIGVIAYTAIDNRIFRGKVFGKVGKRITMWWLVHELLETTFIVFFMAIAFRLFGWHVGTSWIAIVGGIVSWLWLTGDTLVTLVMTAAVGAAVSSRR